MCLWYRDSGEFLFVSFVRGLDGGVLRVEGWVFVESRYTGTWKWTKMLALHTHL